MEFSLDNGREYCILRKVNDTGASPHCLIFGETGKNEGRIQEIITVRKQCAILSAALLILFAGCSILRKEQRRDIAGTWTGTAFVGQQGVQRKYDVVLILREDRTLYLAYDTDKRKFEFRGNYTVDLSEHPARIDITDFGFPNTKMSYCCLSIAEFPKRHAMNISGLIGQCGKVSRPSQFNRNPSNNHQMYLELTQKE